MSITKLLQAFYTFIALRWLRLTGALWILYLLHVGWTLWQVGIAEAAFHAVSFLTAVPTGIFADRVGRRRSLLLGLLIGVLAPPLEYLLAPHGWVAGACALGFSALGWSFIGGADQALLHDLSRRLPEGSRAFARLYGRMDAIALLSSALSAPLGGWLAFTLGWRYAYFGQAFLTLLAILPVLTLPVGEGERAPATVHVPAEVPGLRQAWATVRKTPGLLGLVLFGALLGIAATSNHLYGQSTLVAKGLTVFGATAVIGGASLLAALASALTHRLNLKRAGPAMRRGALALAVLIAAVGSASGILAPVSYALSDGVDGGIDVLYATELNRAAPEALRATIVSVPDALFSLGMIVLFPLEGWAMGRFGLPPLYLVLALMLALATPLVGRGRGRRSGTGAGPGMVTPP